MTNQPYTLKEQFTQGIDVFLPWIIAFSSHENVMFYNTVWRIKHCTNPNWGITET